MDRIVSDAGRGRVVVGIDVGAARKGFHAVALSGGEISGTFQSNEAERVARWVVEQKAVVVAIDAPCRWRMSGGPARPAERELAAERIACFSTPTEEKARAHAFYTWMLAGQELYAALCATHPIYAEGAQRRNVAIESFPHAVACALAGERVAAKDKLRGRKEILRRVGIAVDGLRTIDEIDAALCAVAASAFAEGRAKLYGEPRGGFIVVPTLSWRLR